jgi:hypothetical protein
MVIDFGNILTSPRKQNKNTTAMRNISVALGLIVMNNDPLELSLKLAKVPDPGSNIYKFQGGRICA